MRDDKVDFSGFAPFIKDINVSEPASMITSTGELLDGHIVKIDFGDASLILSATDEVLQKLFFLLLKIFSH